MKEEVVKLLLRGLKGIGVPMKKEEIEKLVEVPPSAEMGDFAFPCFFLSEKLKMDPHEIAIELRGLMGNPPETDFETIETSGPYINFFLNRKTLAKKVVWEVINRKKDYGKSDYGKGKKIVVEFSSPNIAKPFGIGHLRSTIIGNALANICEFQGFKVTRLNYLGDWGSQFGRLILGYKKFGSETRLHKNPISHLLEVYVKANKKKYDKESASWFKKLEDNDREAVMLWRAFREFSLEYFNEIYKMLGVSFDEYSGESKYNKKMKEVLEELKEKKLVHRNEGALVVNLEKNGLGVCLVEKSDGATLYATRDLASAIERHKKYGFDKMIYETGQEQELHFRQIFKILELMGYGWAKNCVHISHGLYLDKDGKKFATRKGKNVFMKDVLEETISLAKKEIKKRYKNISGSKLDERAQKIAMAAIFYGDLKNNRKNNIIFDIKRFLSFEGDTGPYLQYSYARANSILKKAPPQKKFEVYDLQPQEIALVKGLLKFSEIAVSAYQSLNPSVISNYSYQISQLFNEFYHACPVIGSTEEAFRLALVEAFKQVLKNACSLLGIKVMEEM